MASNNDNAMARFLFAILKQKCLKDIDWNKVAHDPVLLQEISNGHAARMRFSRFRQAMLGPETQKRDRSKVPRSKVTKPKKEPGAKRAPPVKPEPSPERGSPQNGRGVDMIPVKNEHTSNQSISYGSRSAVTATLPDHQTQMHTRMLTPCSDNDFMGSPAYSPSPVDEMMSAESTVGMTAMAPPPPHCGHDQTPWQHQTHFQTLSMPYGGLPNYTSDYGQHQMPRQQESHCDPRAIMEAPLHTNIKPEQWDAHFHEV